MLLLSADQKLSIRWSLPYLVVKNETDSGRPLAHMPLAEVLRPGDQVACWVESLEEPLRVSRLMLLTPAQVERPPVQAPLRDWSDFLQHVRGYFSTRGLIEVATPHLVSCPGLEPSLEPFRAETSYLPTSPEIHLKKALSLGFTDIFEIKTCFRKGEMSPQHQPEFHMLEWYRAFADLHAIRADLVGLIKSFGVVEPVTETTFADLFAQEKGFELTPRTSREELLQWAQALQIDSSPSDSWNDLFHRLWIEAFEPQLAKRGPTLLSNFPPSMAALARLGPDGWADRFEFYWNGFEIANAFHEVNDPLEQSARWEMEMAERRHLGTSALEPDRDLIRHLEMGMPPAGGIALGLERLFMALQGLTDIRQTRLFPAR